MKIVFHKKYLNSSYAMDPAAAPGRLEGIIEILSNNPEFEFIEPKPATKEDILRAHSEKHLDYVSRDPLLLELASLAAGGAILAAEEAFIGNPTFAVIRPPGHHASADSCWGFCYFNNISISLLKLYSEGKIKSAFVLDFDLHTGDGNINILGDDSSFTIYNPHGRGDDQYLKDTQQHLDDAPNVDIIVASAGFDQYEHDWGSNLSTEAFHKIGLMIHEFAKERCDGRRYGLLEGGYNFEDLGKNVLAFCEGLRGK